MAFRSIARRTHALRDRLLGPLDRAVIAASPDGPGAPLFVIGAPRAGTTIAYQYLVARFRCGYFSNLERAHALWPALSAYIHRSADHFEASFESERGEIAGRHAPSDGWEIFERYFPRWHDPAQRGRSRRGLAALIGYFESLYGAPFVDKNNANTLRVIELHELFPTAGFVRIERALASNVASILKARQAVAARPDRFWSCGPARSVCDRDFEDEVEHVTFQVMFIDRYVRRAAEQCGIAEFETVDYAEVLVRPEVLVERVRAIRPDWVERADPPTAATVVRSRSVVGERLEERVRECERNLRDSVADCVDRALAFYDLPTMRSEHGPRLSTT